MLDFPGNPMSTIVRFGVFELDSGQTAAKLAQPKES
jgi:hypothetical protein